MNTNTTRPRMLRSLAASSLALLGIFTAGTALAGIASTPSTTAYHFSSHPMIAGVVVSVNDREMVVATDQGERVTLAMDARTMAPRDLAPGMVLRTEFVVLEGCRFYAERIVPVRGGMSTNRFQAYANTTDARDPRSEGTSLAYSRDAGLRNHAADFQASLPQTVGAHSPGMVTTASPASRQYLSSTHPMISGRVLSVNDHQLVVETDQGQRVALLMDSRTMVPSVVEPGTVFRADFTQMNDGRYYAKRITPDESATLQREPAYAHTRDSDAAIAEGSPDCGCASVSTVSSTASVVEHHVDADPVVAQLDEPETLPMTGSSQPLVLLIGLIALGSAGLVRVVRDGHVV
jgi:LPXTG-motif cell wall-anchored protein